MQVVLYQVAWLDTFIRMALAELLVLGEDAGPESLHQRSQLLYGEVICWWETEKARNRNPRKNLEKKEKVKLKTAFDHNRSQKPLFFWDIFGA